ncbi:hypothetical protein [Marinobacter bohaiensis]|uniref:hypothetical protein n=1 Tax=Marinobacter bohaiensis TaxID=2201898 RepID=UPI0019550E1A|nr:hypothetical protein [Marinobacter bohaiensis]
MAVSNAKERPTPVLQPGRPADPVPPEATPAPDKQLMPEQAPQSRGRTEPEAESQTESPHSTDEAIDDRDEGADESGPGESREQVMVRRGNRRRLLRQCERVLLLDFATLSMPDWPDNFSMAAARRRRDLWLFSATLAGAVFLCGIPGIVPAWVAGTGFGAFVLIALAGVPFIRRIFSSKPSYMELLLRRQHRLREARSHINHLEGEEGLAWQCAMMADFNPALRSTRFSGLVNLSEKRILAKSLRRREHFRLYLIYMLEAEKAYDRLQAGYFEDHQHAIDQGWLDGGPAEDASTQATEGEEPEDAEDAERPET